MNKLILKIKIKKELKKFKEFKKSFQFEFKEFDEREDGSIYYDNICVKNGKTEEILEENDKIVNAYFKSKSPLAKILSNLFPYQFVFRGFKIQSAEAIFQCLKYKNKKMQRLIFDYSGIVSNNIKRASDYNWRNDHILYFLGKPMNRDGKEYEDFIDELYISLLQNPLYRNALKNVGNRYIMHSIGEKETTETLFTRYEFERQLNCLKAFVNSTSK